MESPLQGGGPVAPDCSLAPSLPSLFFHLTLLLLLLPSVTAPSQCRLSPISPRDQMLQWGPGQAWQGGVKRLGEELPARHKEPEEGHCRPRWSRQKSGSGLNP